MEWLNTHSTLVMGKLMSDVCPTNNKLVDHAIRYVRSLFERHGLADPVYREVAVELFRLREILKCDEPVVVKTLEGLMAAEPESGVRGLGAVH